MPGPAPLHYGHYYHIYNRGNNRETIFIEPRNYEYFLQLYTKYIPPIASTLAYCLLGNHFHFFVRIGPLEEIQRLIRIPETKIVQYPSLQFGHFFNAYTKTINMTYHRTGSLFEKPFKRIPITSTAHFTHLIAYIHRNPQTHGFVDDFRTWPYSSYQEIQHKKPARVQPNQVLDWFGGLDRFTKYHSKFDQNHQDIAHLIPEDDDIATRRTKT